MKASVFQWGFEMLWKGDLKASQLYERIQWFWSGYLPRMGKDREDLRFIHSLMFVSAETRVYKKGST
jgi:hypothetical protein